MTVGGSQTRLCVIYYIHFYDDHSPHFNANTFFHVAEQRPTSPMYPASNHSSHKRKWS